MGLKERIKRLEQSHGAEPERVIGLCIMPCNKPKPTQEQIDAFEAKIDWTKGNPQSWAWTGDKFVCTASEYLKAQGYDCSNFDPERELVFCILKKGVTA